MRSSEELKDLDKYVVVNPRILLMKKLLELSGNTLNAPTTYRIPYNDRVDMWVLVSVDFGWEHVSVSLLSKNSEPTPIERCPKWEEMSFIKELFWNDDECVVQFHPAKENYVNNHPYVLHLWKFIDGSFPTPPKELV